MSLAPTVADDLTDARNCNCVCRRGPFIAGDTREPGVGSDNRNYRRQSAGLHALWREQFNVRFRG
jgi:hypothetical protein